MRNNVVQEKTYNFALRIVKLYQYLEEQEKYMPLHKQLLRSGTSVAANTEEALGGYSRNDFAYKLQIAYKEARESKFWLRLFRDTDMLETRIADSLIADAEEIIKILVSILKTTKENNKY